WRTRRRDRMRRRAGSLSSTHSPRRYFLPSALVFSAAFWVSVCDFGAAPLGGADATVTGVGLGIGLPAFLRLASRFLTAFSSAAASSAFAFSAAHAALAFFSSAA